MGYFWGRGRVQKLFWGLFIMTNNFCFQNNALFLPYQVVLSSCGGGGGCSHRLLCLDPTTLMVVLTLGLWMLLGCDNNMWLITFTIFIHIIEKSIDKNVDSKHTHWVTLSDIAVIECNRMIEIGISFMNVIVNNLISSVQFLPNRGTSLSIGFARQVALALVLDWI